MQYVVDESGEILEVINTDENIAKLKKGDRVIRGNSIEYFTGTVPIKYKKFYKINELACEELNKYGNYLFLIFPYIGFSDGILIFSNGRRLRPKHLAGIIGKKNRSGSKVIQELIEKDVLHKHKEGRTYYFTLNPYIALKGNRITKDLYDEFKTTKYRKNINGDNL